MSESELKYPSWQRPLREAILEFDRETLTEKIKEVETLVLKRLKEMSSDPDHDDERQALADATTVLCELKKARLSYPAWGTQTQD
jgi:hypothetical protein